MIITILISPFSIFYVLGWVSLSVFLPVALACGALFGAGVRTGTPGLGETLCVVLTAVLTAAQLSVLLAMMVVRGVDANFNRFPWLAQQKSLRLKGGDESYVARCPYTGLRPLVRCPSCGCHISDLALRDQRKMPFEALGDEPLRWDAASAVLSSGLPLAAARQKLDQVLDFRGSHIFVSCSPACRGCATWQRAFNLAPRLALTLSFAAVPLSLVPWAVGSTLERFDGAGEAVQASCMIFSIYLAAASVLVQLQALARSEDFLHGHQDAIPGLVPLLPRPSSATVRALQRELCLARWSPGGGELDVRDHR